MKKAFLFTSVILILMLITAQNQAQVAVNTDNSIPDPSAGLDVKFNNKGVLIPRMTKVERNGIINPANGLMVYCTNCGTDGSLSIYSNGTWKTFAPCTIDPPVAGTHLMSQGQIIWNWLATPGATGYRWSTTPDYETATDLGNNLSRTETGTSCNITYTRYVWAYSSCGESLMTILTQTVPPSLPSTPTAGTHIATKTSVVWTWNSVSGASGYKWSSTNVFSTATDVGTATSTTETGLTCGTSYTRYVWAYNGCGYSNAGVLSQISLSCWACGDPFTINHVATGMPGAVAPVTKTVTYGTITNLPGEVSKCWITSNLGSDHQATSPDDATEASAGWYWQFNRKQGYKHDGTLRTPNTAWISPISENSDWTAVNDPCSIELGSSWRIPTYTEWNNVFTWGPWSLWTDPWNSGLRIHDAGDLNTGGYLNSTRGIEGMYWSSSQYDATHAWYLFVGNSGVYPQVALFHGFVKAYGYTIRCIK